ncbi:MAG TPA: glycoside hydrolase family 3 N-terminal domain-containing protein [Longimicrobiales bacterium]|nr:glycoside hydrolase family 3 N-terminal domain-containing protein [Longimicrobiales bacterium]
MEIARLLFPAIRWDPASQFDGEGARVDQALAQGVGGFIFFGGTVDAVRELTTDLRMRSDRPLLFGSDLERGAGQQFEGATQLPPLAALGWLGDPEISRRAGHITGSEAVSLGVHWIYAPVADVDLEPRNPIVGTRSFGTDPAAVAEHVAAWIEGCRAAGALACAKHFPGHGRTTTDSHIELPRVSVDRQTLEDDLLPFRRAIQAGVDSVMTAHVRFDALDPSGAPATLSRSIVDDLLRRELRFDGVVVTDAMIMEGVLEGGAGEGVAAVHALAAGCDALLYPADPAGVAEYIAHALGADLDPGRVDEALRRVERAAGRTGEPIRVEHDWQDAADWALEIAVRTVHPVRGRPALAARALDLLTVDDDVGGPYPPGPRDTFPAGLRAGREIREVRVADAARPLVIAVYADIRAWKGRPGVSPAAVRRVRDALLLRPDATIVLFGHPRLASDLPGENILAAWGGDRIMQRAAASWLLARSTT